MRQLIFTALSLLFSMPLLADGGNVNQAKISFDESVINEKGQVVYDYGTIYQNSDGVCEFRFKNTGKEPLVLTKVRSSCGCTVPTWPRHPILPGKESVIEVKYDTRRVGRIYKTITIYSNASNSPVVARIEGVVVSTESEFPVKTKPLVPVSGGDN
jgi:hypothetical protein